MNKEDLSHIKVEERVWDYRMSFALFNFTRTEDKPDKKEKTVKIGELENSENLIAALKEVLGSTIKKNMNIDTVMDMLREADLDEQTKEKYKDLFYMGKEEIWIKNKGKDSVIFITFDMSAFYMPDTCLGIGR